jgi:hypothetical protein
MYIYIYIYVCVYLLLACDVKCCFHFLVLDVNEATGVSVRDAVAGGHAAVVDQEGGLRQNFDDVEIAPLTGVKQRSGAFAVAEARVHLKVPQFGGVVPGLFPPLAVIEEPLHDVRVSPQARLVQRGAPGLPVVRVGRGEERDLPVRVFGA